MAHFLEHLVFKGGEKYADYRKVNETAERMGGVLNAYTSHDLVAFHITVRAEAALPAIDLLTDFAGRPQIDADELDRERGVVIQEIQRYKDQPAAVAEQLIDRAAFGEHPLGRTVLGPEEHLRTFTRDAIVAFRERRWAGRARRRVHRRQPRARADSNGAVAELFERFPTLPEPAPYEPAPVQRNDRMVEERDTNQSHLRMLYRAEDRRHEPARARGAVDLHDAARRLDGLAPVRRDPRAARPRLLRVGGRPRASADAPALGLGAGLASDKTLEAYTRMREIVTELRERGPDRVRGRACARVRGRPPGARLREHERGRAVRGGADDRLRRGHRPRRRDQGAGRCDVPGGCGRGRGRG